MKTYRYKLNLIIESPDDQEDWIKENIEDLIASPEEDFISLKSYELKKEMFVTLTPEDEFRYSQEQGLSS